MPILSWSDSYSVGVEEIDEEHKELISLINKAEAAVNMRGDDKTIAKVASDMAFYALTHFSNEEVLMLSNDYPDFEEHREQHKEFSDKAKLLEKSLAGGADDFKSQDVFQYLSQWLIDHIMVSDKKLGAYLNEQGIQ